MKKIIYLLLALAILCGCANKETTETTNNLTVREDVKVESDDCITADESWNRIGETLCVQYYAGNPSTSKGGTVFLNEKQNYTAGFTTTIFASSKSRFSDPAASYGYKTIKVTGLIKLYDNHPEIVAEDPKQITIAG